MVLTDVLRSEIDRRRLTQSQAAVQIGVRQQVLSRWLQPDPPRPSLDNCVRIARFLGRTPLEVQRLAGYELPDDDVPRRRNRIDPRLQLVRSQVESMRGELDKLWQLVSAIVAVDGPSGSNKTVLLSIPRLLGRSQVPV